MTDNIYDYLNAMYGLFFVLGRLKIIDYMDDIEGRTIIDADLQKYT